MTEPAFVPFARPDITEAEIEAVARAMRSGWVTTGPEPKAFEQEFGAYLGGGLQTVAVNSATAGLHLALEALGIGPGDEVIAPTLTFTATVEVARYLGADARLVDVDPVTLNIDPAQVEAAITPRTRAILPVSLYGQVPDMDAINAIAARHGKLPVIEDAAQSFGAIYRDRQSCNLSTFGCTSFFPSKPLGCYGDGGAIFTNDDALAQACREIRIHGQSKRYTHTRVGVGGRMDTLQCAIVLAKLERFDWELQERLVRGQLYNAACDAAGIARVHQRADRNSVFGQYTVRVPNRDQIQERLKAAGVPTAVHYPVPMNRQPAYAGLCERPTPVADRLAAEVMSLPMSADLTLAQQEAVMQALRQAAAK